MKLHHSIFGLRSRITFGFFLLLSFNLLAQVKTYEDVFIDSLEVNNIKIKTGTQLSEVINKVLYEEAIIKDLNFLDSINEESCWRNNIYNRKIPMTLKPFQFAIDTSNRYFYFFDGNAISRIPIIYKKTNNNSVNFIPLENPPNDFKIGTIYFDKNTNRFKYFNGKKWKSM